MNSVRTRRWWVAGGLLAPLLVASIAAGSPRAITLNDHGIAGAPFASAQRFVVSFVDSALGRPSRAVAPTPFLSTCGVDAAASWGGFTAFFEHRRFAGYSLGPSSRTSVLVEGGLRLGETLALARRQFGARLRTSQNQGGAWFARTPTGRYYGFLRPSGPPPGPASRLATIEAGRVGCPALTP